MKSWWNENWWKIRIHIMTLLIFPVNILESVILVILFVFDRYRDICTFILWDVINYVIKKRSDYHRKKSKVSSKR